ncbi:MAG: HD domain-containing phosphohydrolase [Candidatus Dormibacterales bacterium]
MKTAQRFNVYVLGGQEQGELARNLAGLGFEVKSLGRPAAIERPAVIVLGDGQTAPEGLADLAISPPPGTSGQALRELVRMGIENVILRQELAHLEERAKHQHTQFDELNRIGIALSAERDLDQLQALILLTMRQLTNADGASLWLRTDDDGPPQLFLKASQNHSIEGSTYQAFKVALDDKSVVGFAVTSATSLLYDDAYNPPPGKPKGGRGFDALFGYRTKSMLTVPMRNYQDEVIGAIQLINAKRRFDVKLTVDAVDAEVVSFQPDDLPMIESIASQAAVALDKQKLLDSIQDMFDGFVKASVTAIEQRDPTTAGHSGRVEKLTTELALAVNQIAVGKFRERLLTEEELQVLKYACLLHDFGKVGVRENILVKAKKLEAGQLDLIRMRFDYIQRSEQVKRLSEQIEIHRKKGVDESALAAMYQHLEGELRKLRVWYEAVATANEPSVLPEAETYIAAVLAEISDQTYDDMDGKPHPMLEPQEFRFLSIPKGTLDPQERKQMEDHVTHSWNFLNTIPWPVPMRRIPEIAYAHHEKLDGTGYPRRLTGEQIPLEARMMTIADIYDALTATDRPYKRAISKDMALDILHTEANRGQLDKDLLDVFVTKEIYLATAS